MFLGGKSCLELLTIFRLFCLLKPPRYFHEFAKRVVYISANVCQNKLSNVKNKNGHVGQVALLI